MKITLIYNPNAGSSNGRLKYILDYFHARNVEVKILSKGEHPRTHIVIAAGGDGTINSVVNTLSKNQVLGILPLGTANVIATELKIPLTLDDALARIMLGKLRSIDAGVANGHKFLLCCGIGFDAQVAHDVGLPLWKKTKRISFMASILQQALIYDHPELTVAAGKKKYTAAMVVASNAQRYGGDIVLCPSAKIDDGFLTVNIVKDFTLAKLITTTVLGSVHGEVPLTHIQQFKAKNICVTSNVPTLVHCDAEIIGTTPVEVTIMPKALRVIV